MSKDRDDELDRQMRSLASQLTDDKVEEIRARLGLRDPGSDSAHAKVTQDPAATYSFCGADESDSNRLVQGKSGAVICARCLSMMQSP